MRTQKVTLKDPNDPTELAIMQSQVETNPHCRSYLTISRLTKGGLDLQTLFDNISQQSVAVTEKNNLESLEQMLISQAHVLQAVFHHSAERISSAETIEQLRAYSDIAIKANGACRKTVAAISHLKNPTPTTFIKQQNNAVNQQVNNGIEPKKIIEPANELLSIKENHHETLDIRGTLTASGVNQKVAALEKSRRENS